MSSLRLIQFTDTHLYGEADGKLRGVATYPALLAAIEHARARHWPCQAILATGDLVQDDPEGYARFRDQESDHPRRWWQPVLRKAIEAGVAPQALLRRSLWGRELLLYRKVGLARRLDAVKALAAEAQELGVY